MHPANADIRSTNSRSGRLLKNHQRPRTFRKRGSSGSLPLTIVLNPIFRHSSRTTPRIYDGHKRIAFCGLGILNPQSCIPADTFRLYNSGMNMKNTADFSDDYFRSFGRNWKQEPLLKRIFCLLTNHGLRYLHAFRALQQHRGMTFFHRFVKRVLRQHYGLELDSMSIGKGLYLGHPYNISVSEFASIGENCNLNKGVTIGAENRGARAGAPTLGNKVWVGTNAVVVGKITIGDNVMIAPNAFVNRDVPADSIVIGNPMQVIPNRPDATEGYIENVC